MTTTHPVTKKDMMLLTDALKYTTPANVPLQFCLDGCLYRGIPQSFNPKVSYRMLTCNIVQYVIEGCNADGLQIRAEYLEYRDFPVTEWVVYFTNLGEKTTSILSDVRVGGDLLCPSPVLEHGNGDTFYPDGYQFFKDAVDREIRLTPNSGTSCQGAFPYMTLHGADREFRIAIGWPTKWVAEISPAAGGIRFVCGQERCHTVLRPNECFRTPRLNIMVYEKGENSYRGINLWRRWYFKHIMPVENGKPIAPKLCLHYFQADGKPEFTGASEENQIHALKEYIRRGMKPDVWWVDAGWYPCDYHWTHTGTWIPDPARFPNGLAPLGKACEENGVQFLLWFEPERVREQEELDREHPEWLLSKKEYVGDEKINRLLDLGNPQALNWLIEHVDGLIKSSHVSIYRQDFNFDPAPIWRDNEAEDRVGMLENRHALGYLAYWDALLLRNPGLVIDSCASGGRRNDLETMRRAITLHYTDVGYGHHPIKQRQHREMFEWIPYFRAHNMNWDNVEDGTYNDGSGMGCTRPADEFSFHVALAPALTSMYEYNDTEEHFEVGRCMDEIWRAAAELELSGDYYPMTECRCDAHDWYAMQFDDPDQRRGFVQVIRNTLVEGDTYLVKLPCVHPDMIYTLTDRRSGATKTLASEELEAGFEVKLPKRSAVIWFYEYTVKS